ncbi:electron-transferring-flavoprotein dehydrogenase Ecym_5032 [Eremothecium cymbalariae DBVPG|uniref:Electron transfer flavoprotein-ubiquinone oxidoreductase n=1 Tax=Eremothecium cymbalariae (strain CBS 270.75 / DBVPG 7215 / KCTC 17166 / NRRL Y-17582) TaxID=931890 RepID=I6NCP0_ERECY|nr:hypothetical protein Ecym_5032 [Eremothecium cymbalariae DBVPG\
MLGRSLVRTKILKLPRTITGYSLSGDRLPSIISVPSLKRGSHIQDKPNLVRKFSVISCHFQNVEVPISEMTQDELSLLRSERARDKVDVCIVGGGPSGLVTAIKLKQLDHLSGSGELRVVVLDKGPEIGSHIVSGAILEPTALRELFPESEFYDEDGSGIPLPSDLVTKVEEEEFKYLFGKFAVTLPEPPEMVNKGKNFIVSLSQVTTWLSEKAEELGVEVYSGIAVSEVIYSDEEKSVLGVATKDMGISKSGKPKDSFERGMEFRARQTVFAEGCHGSLTKQLIKKFNLREGRDNQTYGLGLKEVWEVKPENFKKGFASHTLGYPLSTDMYGGGFQYHFGDGLVTVGLIVGLDYKNPWVSPYQEFQKMKHHPYYANVLRGGKCIGYAARALNEGGIQSVPKLCFPGGCLVGAAAGFLNVPKIKGTHTAMKTGMLAAEEIFKAISSLPTLSELEEQGMDDSAENIINLESYEKAFKNSWVYKELWRVRNIRPSFNTRLSRYGGILYSGLDSYILKGKVGWTFHHHQSDATCTEPASKYNKIEYPKPDGKLSFDIMTSVSRTGTYHDEDERCHLRVPDQDMKNFTKKSYPKWKGIESRFCPAGVYEYVEDENSPLKLRFQINSQNCIHCKTCDIKSPTQDINWEVPEGAKGPKYSLT